MKLEAFVRSNMESILAEWESFARTLPPCEGMTSLALRDHAKQMLLAIVDDMATARSDTARAGEARGEDCPQDLDSAASLHGELRFTSQFSIVELAAEFRALRSTVLRLWARSGSLESEGIVRFNESLDKALAESIDAFEEKANTMRDIFIGVLGHDLRAPLGTISGAADVLLARPDSPSALQLGGSVRRAARHMAGMIDNLINYTRLQLGAGLPHQPAMVDLATLCDDAIVDARAAFPDSEFVLRVEGDVRGIFDPVTLRQLVTNLFVNAAQHGERARPINAMLHATPECVVLCVENHGRVIPESEIGQLFQPLVRLPGADASSHVGRSSLGLGLFIAHAVAKSHGGDISATSSESGLTRFVVTLPLRNK